MIPVEKAIAYWDQGIDRVPGMTGASTLLDARDFVSICDELGIALPLSSVFDVGCGTGRIARHCHVYAGMDIAPSAVAYCQRAGLTASLIQGPADLSRWKRGVGLDWITCLSVFTHIPHEQRCAYLTQFIGLAPNLLVDIIPGDGTGDIAQWTADVPTFLASLTIFGYRIVATTDRISPTNVHHRYVWAQAFS